MTRSTGVKLSPSKRKQTEGSTVMKQTKLDFAAKQEGKGGKGTGLVAARGLSSLPSDMRITRRAAAPRKSERIAEGSKPDQLSSPPPQQKQKQKAAGAGAAATARKGSAASARAVQQPAGRGSSSPARKGRRRVLQEVDRGDGDVLRVGDCVYVVLDERCLGSNSDGEEQEEECCMVCGSSEQEEEVMLECGRCLGGWHLGCLDPPLDEVPEGDWLCPDCTAGKPVPPRAASCSRERFLQQQGLGLGRIEGLWEDADGEEQCMLRWFEVPDNTHIGRQKHNAAREVFLTQQRDQVEVASLEKVAHALPPEDFYRGSDALGDNVFLCEYEYDTVWERFRRRTQFDSSDEEDNWCPSSDDEAEEEDRDAVGSKPIYACWAEKGFIKAKNMRGGRSRGSRKKQGGEQFLDRVGALAIPEHVRQHGRRGGAGGEASALAQARSMLTLTVVPESLPCREPERRQVEQFVEEVLADTEEAGCGRCLYVSGIPGTGKTATVLEVMRGFKRRAEVGEAPHFQFVEINGLRLPSPQHAYSALYEALTGDRVGPQNAAQLLDDMMSSSGRKGAGLRRPTIVLVDEMDVLVNRTQTVLYNLFDWPGRKGSRLSIIGIANTMDLPERLHQRISSRLAGRRVVFHPYRTEQLEQIIASRLEGLTAFEPRAAKLVSQKVANCSGDVRRCLELCRRAAEIAEERWIRQQRELQRQQQEGGGASSGSSSAAAGSSQQQLENGTVQMRHVHAAIQEMFNTSHVLMIKSASRLERLLLAALHLEARFSGRAEALLEDVADRLRNLCSNNMEHQYEFGAVVEAAVRLGSKRIILCDPGQKRLKMKMSLNVPLNDLEHALKADTQIAWLADRLGTVA